MKSGLKTFKTMDTKLKQLIEFIHAEKAKATSEAAKNNSTGNNAFDNDIRLVNCGRVAMCQDILLEAERLIFNETQNN